MGGVRGFSTVALAGTGDDDESKGTAKEPSAAAKTETADADAGVQGTSCFAANSPGSANKAGFGKEVEATAAPVTVSPSPGWPVKLALCNKRDSAGSAM